MKKLNQVKYYSNVNLTTMMPSKLLIIFLKNQY